MDSDEISLSSLSREPSISDDLREPASPLQKKETSMKNLIFASVCSYLGALSFGYMIGYSSPAIPQMVAKGGPLDVHSASWFGSIATFGALFGCPIAGWLVDRFGRKISLMCIAFPFIVGWFTIMLSDSVHFLCIGRLLTGVGSGMVTVISPMYIAEISTKEYRGMFGSGVQLAITLGILLVYALGLSFQWRTLAFVGLTIPVLSIFLVLRVPETPRYFLKSGRRQDALRALDWLRGPHHDIEDECRDIEESLDVDTSSTVSWSEFKKPELMKPLTVSMGLMALQQLSGINVVMFYTVSIFQSAGYKENGEMATVMIGMCQVVMTLVACWLMDKAGRRILLIAGSVGMAGTCFSMGLYYYISSTNADQASSISWLALISLIGYIMAFSIGWGPIPMLVMSEVFPARARGAASAIACLTSWGFAFLVTKEFQSLQDVLGQHGAFWFFGGCCLFSLWFVWKYVPETKGKSLEDIELYFLGRAMRGI